ncbi:MAG TPA: cytochrome c maturation protein CcmE [Chromatiales bacterium]|nr:cytochrome c maturation protein CcmE [Thiotrichales bacterium]HIP66986.1 cytochrome c maturation protein CcmE [Chromatiales bacterium]
MKPRQKRMVLILLALVGVGLAATLATVALRSNLSYYYSPIQIASGEAPKDQVIRVGGLVKEGSMKREPGDLTLEFVVTDNKAETTVRYAGILPDLFKEGTGMVGKGKMGQDGIFYAEEVLAKHDEDYLPPEVQDSLETAHEEGIKEMANGQQKL